jgi:exodeoxyribonuclease V alpha subunit
MSNDKKVAILSGRVKYIHKGSFSIQEVKDGKFGDTYRCFLSKYYLPVLVGDVFNGPVEITRSPGGLNARLISEPLILVPNDMETLMSQMVNQKSLKLSRKDVEKLLSIFTEYAINKERKRLLTNNITITPNLICSYLDRCAQECSYEFPSVKGVAKIPTEISVVTKAMEIIEWVNKQRNRRRLWLFGLTNKDISESHIDPLELFSRIVSNPLTVTNLGIEKCESIFRRLNKTFTNLQLVDAKIARKMREDVVLRGHTATNVKRLLKDFPNLAICLSSLAKDYEVTVDTTQHILYLPFQLRVENHIATFIAQAIKSSTPIFKLSESYSDSKLTAIDDKELKLSNSLSADQRQAVVMAINNRFSIIDGRAGTGKTTTIKEVVKVLKHLKIIYHICAFTGQAASRIRKVTDEDATTIHRFLARLKGESDIQVIIIDEFSMVPATLMYQLMVMMPNAAFICIGDSNQLPPIDWGAVMNQLMSVPMVPRATLVQNHRMYKVQGEVDYVLLNANNIADGVTGTDGKFHFIEGSNFKVINADITYVSEMLKFFKAQGIDKDKLTIITPYIEYISPINKMFQDIYFADNKSVVVDNKSSIVDSAASSVIDYPSSVIDYPSSVIDYKGVKWCVGDRVMALENDYDRNVMNGETGLVVEVTKQQVTIKFEAGEYSFELPQDPKEILTKQYLESNNGVISKEPEPDRKSNEKGLTYSKLIHAFCATTHKLQGSEQEYCIFFCPARNASGFLNRNLLYTALTRAKRCMYVVGDVKTIETAAQRKLPYRCETLALKINALCPPTEDILKKLNSIPKTQTTTNNTTASQEEDDGDYAPYNYGDY